MKKKSFCPYCRAPLKNKFCEGRLRRYCDTCREPIYENPVPATGVVVADGPDRILLVKRNIEPKLGQWCLPGGFMELDETPEQCALRELKEETGLSGRINVLIGVTAHPNRLYGTVLMLGYLVTQCSGRLTPGDDVSEAAYFQQDLLPEVAFESHRRFIRIYSAAYKA
jgi:8-oxo-dGTP diphosphatase